MTVTGSDAGSAVIAPADNAELLGAGAQVLAAARIGKNGAMLEATRDYVLSFLRARVLVVVDGDVPHLFPSPQGPVLVAFTDDDAAGWWARNRHPAEPVDHSLAPNLPQPQESIGPGRDWWSQWCAKLSATGIAINPAGPVSTKITANHVRRVTRRLFGGSRPVAEEALLDLDERERVRADFESFLVEFRAAADSSDHRWLASHMQAVKDLGEAGSNLWTSEMLVLSGRLLATVPRAETQLLGAREHLDGALGFANYGDPYRAVDSLLDNFRIVRELRDGGVDSSNRKLDSPSALLAEAAKALSQLRVGYREGEINMVGLEVAGRGRGR